MCGICCRIIRRESTPEEESSSKIDSLTLQLLRSRGPNTCSELTIHGQNYNILFTGCVLWQQGQTACQQPFTYKHHILLLNGDIFTKRIDNSQSDTEWLIQNIYDCNDNEDKLCKLFRDIEGPYSIIYFNKNSQKLYFLRDSLGRQTLLLAKYHSGDTIISSVLGASTENLVSCIELPPLGMFCTDFNLESTYLYPWHDNDTLLLEQLRPLEQTLGVDVAVMKPILPYWITNPSHSPNEYLYDFESILSEFMDSEPEIIFNELLRQNNVLHTCHELIRLLKNSISDRVLTTPSYCGNCLNIPDGDCKHAKIGILFSGGIDCTILAMLANEFIDIDQPIDLINVSFEKIVRTNKSSAPIDYNTPDRISARNSLVELNELTKRQWNLIEVNVTREELNKVLRAKISNLAYPLNSVLDESLASVLYFAARGQGIVNGIDYASSARVFLIGSGADELFGGYSRHRNAFIRSYQDNLKPFERLEKELEFDFARLPSRNLARDDRVIGNFGITLRSPFLEENFVHFVRSLKANQKCYPALKQGVGDKLIIRFCGFLIGLRQVTSLKKRAMQFGSRVADSKQNAKDISQSLSF